MDVGDKYGSSLYVTEDGGDTFFKFALPFQLTGDITFYPRKEHEDYLLASSAILSTKVREREKERENIKSFKDYLNPTIKNFQSLMTLV